MKKQLLHIALVGQLILMIAGCSDFLDVKPRGKDIPEDIKHFEGLFNNNILTNLTFYEVLENGAMMPKASELYYLYMTDELIADSTSYTRLSRGARAAFSYEPDLFVADDYSAEWSAAYQQIYLYNVIANGVMDAEDGTLEKKKELLAEARVGRAFMHFYLTQFFCKPYHPSTAASDAGIPIVTKGSSGETSFSRGTVKEVYDFVTREMEEACPDLPQQTQNRQRVYRAAGYFMLGKVYLTMGEYDKALKALEESMKALGNTTIEMDLFDYNTQLAKWGYTGESYRWAITCSYPINLDASNIEIIYNKQVSLIPLVFYFYPPSVFVKPEFMALFTPNDHRSKFFSNRDYTGSNQWPYYKRVCRMIYTISGDLPDLYLMLAECKARTGDETGAREDLLTLREKRMPASEAGVPAEVNTKDKLIRFVIDERKREYMMTGMRWFDMRRLWNDPLFQQDKAACTHTNGIEVFPLTEERLTYKIPPRVMEFNGNWND